MRKGCNRTNGVKDRSIFDIEWIDDSGQVAMEHQLKNWIIELQVQNECESVDTISKKNGDDVAQSPDLNSIEPGGLYADGYIIRAIRSDYIRDLDFGQFKLAIYGVTVFETDAEFNIILDSVKDKRMKAVVVLIERKGNRAIECYAGDLSEQFRDKILSFRGTFIEQNVAVSSRASHKFNRESPSNND